MQASRTLRRLLQGTDPGARHPFQLLNRHYERATSVVKMFYLFSVVIVYWQAAGLHQDAITAAELDLAWPVLWLDGLNIVRWADIFSLSAFLCALVAAWQPGLWTMRMGFALSLLMCGGIAASFGGINHGYHAWLWVAVVLSFLPSGASRPDRLSYCLIFATAQGLLLSFYTLAGLWKVKEGLELLLIGYEGNLAPRGLALTLADRIMQTNTEPLLARFLIDNYLAAWPMFLFLIYAQVVAIAAAYKRSLHVAWGLILIGFHVGTWLLMEIYFPTHVMLLLLLLVCSPFAPADWLQWKTLGDMPLLGILFRRWPRGRRAQQLAAAE